MTPSRIKPEDFKPKKKASAVAERILNSEFGFVGISGTELQQVTIPIAQFFKEIEADLPAAIKAVVKANHVNAYNRGLYGEDGSNYLPALNALNEIVSISSVAKEHPTTARNNPLGQKRLADIRWIVGDIMRGFHLLEREQRKRLAEALEQNNLLNKGGSVIEDMKRTGYLGIPGKDRVQSEAVEVMPILIQTGYLSEDALQKLSDTHHPASGIFHQFQRYALAAKGFDDVNETVVKLAAALKAHWDQDAAKKYRDN